RTLNLATAEFLPWKDYRPGDWIFGPGKASGAIQRLRVAQISITQGADGVVGGSVVLHDRLLERAVAQQKELNALTNGAIVGGGAQPTEPAPPGREPAVPGNLGTPPSVAGAAYIDAAGTARAVITISWPEVLVGEDGQPIDIDHYEVRIRKRV